jgi:hypothetical protein
LPDEVRPEESGSEGRLEMSAYRESYSRLAPAHLMTLVAMMQAIALERLVEQVTGLRGIPMSGLELVGCAALTLVILEGVVILWLLYAQLFCVLEWVPFRTEALQPFGFGLVQFVAIALIEPDRAFLGIFVYGLISLGSLPSMRRWAREAGAVSDNARALAGLPVDRVIQLSAALGILCLLAGLVGFWSTLGLVIVGAAAAVTNASILACWLAGWWRSIESAEPRLPSHTEPA